MSARDISFNTVAIPLNLEQRITALNTQALLKAGRFSVNLPNKVTLDRKNWPVRHQYGRGTCNAFAALAAEEALTDRDVPTPLDLSEEFLYGKARQKNIDSLVAAGVVTDSDRAVLDRSGGTYLSQIRDALEADGSALETEVPYDTDTPVPLSIDRFDPEIETAAKTRAVRGGMIHDISKADIAAEREWLNGSQSQMLPLFFAERISKNVPVILSLAILNDAEYVWTGHLARSRGVIRYPPDDIVKLKRPTAGHSVCLLGYTLENEGEFLFRNSYGTDLFARNAGQFPDQFNTSKPGYGVISFQDVSRFCWEYLTRGTSEQQEQFFGGQSEPQAEIR